MSIPTGSVGIGDDGTLTPGSNGFALGRYLSLKATNDNFTNAQGASVPPDSERVKELQYYAEQATQDAIVFCPHLV